MITRILSRAGLVSLLSIVACASVGANGSVEDYHDPARWDGTPETDRAFLNQWEEDNWCTENPDSFMCSDDSVGQSEQAWVSAEHHGWDVNTTHPRGASATPTCYSNEDNGGPNTSCDFPWLKQVNVTFDDTQCWNATPGPGQPPFSALQVQEYIDNLKIGILKWNGAGTGVVVTINGSNQGKIPVLAVCASLPSGTIGRARLVSNTVESAQTQFSQTPVSPNGEDRGIFRKVKGGSLEFDMRQTLSSYTGCDAGTPSTSERRVFIGELGQHEMGHVMGFGHFKVNPNPMHAGACPGQPHQSITPIQQAFKTALSIFDSTNGNATIQDVGLDDLDPN